MPARVKIATRSPRVPRPAYPLRLRLVDAAALAAAGLLVLKLAGLALEAAPERAPEPFTDAPPPFARILAHARSIDAPIDPITTNSVSPKEEPKPEVKESSVPPSAAANALNGAPTASPSERVLLERLGERRETLQRRDRDLDVRERLLENAERRLEGRVNDLKGLEDKAEAAASRKGDGEAGALKPLVTMYETMKPKDAARVFDRLALDVLVPVVLQMNPRKMAEVLAAMQPESAEKLTVALATRARGPAEGRSAAGGALPSTELPAIDPPRPPR